MPSAAWSTVSCSDFEHEGVHRTLQWDLRHATRVIDALAHHVDDVERRRVVEQVRRVEGARIAGLAPRLPVSVIHGDITDDNVVRSRRRARHARRRDRLRRPQHGMVGGRPRRDGVVDPASRGSDPDLDPARHPRVPPRAAAHRRRGAGALAARAAAGSRAGRERLAASGDRRRQRLRDVDALEHEWRILENALTVPTDGDDRPRAARSRRARLAARAAGNPSDRCSTSRCE